MTLEDDLRAKAKEIGPIAAGSYRVMVLEQDLRTTHHDFPTREDAIQYANDSASETGDEQAIAYVFDDSLATIHRGRPYFA